MFVEKNGGYFVGKNEGLFVEKNGGFLSVCRKTEGFFLLQKNRLIEMKSYETEHS